MDPRAYHDGRVEVLRLDAWTEDDAEDEDHPNQIGMAEELCLSPELKLNSAMDLESWIDELSARDASLLEGRMAGYSLAEIGHDMGWSAATTCQKIKKLGLELASRAGVRIERSGRGRRRGR